MIRMFPLLAALSLLFLPPPAAAQTKKYPSLLWEITGNGLKKPSYLFGTMHISNKMVFHLSDSFYMGIRNADVVALELNPELWQNDIPRMNRQSRDYQRFVSTYTDDYLHQSSFTADGFRAQLKAALSTEPALNNALLYRTQRGMDDFEENTYLDLYIYQTGRKLGKQAAGVEQYIQSQRLMAEAYVDMANEKKKPRPRRSEVSPYEINQTMQDAYRAGDLDLLDSLTRLTEESEAYTEKFLYQRNEIQAASMDSIMRRQALFVGVGAAHLPGPRGVIEILRKKGYRLRPIHMQDRDGGQKETIDTLRVPVRFTLRHAADSMYRVAVPGPLHPLSGSSLDRMDYADMANGSYYLITRVRTYRLFNGLTEAQVLRSVDSMLYEAIPGKILSKEKREQNGYPGFDIVNRTRRGDLQRYRIFVTPHEVLVFKMGGNEQYVAGSEAEQFFGSIQLKEATAAPGHRYQPAEGGFALTFPAPVARYDNPAGGDNQPRLELEAVAPNGDVYMLLRKDIHTFSFLEEDSFAAGLAAESMLGEAEADKILYRRAAKYQGYAAVEGGKATGDGQYLHLRSVVQGPHQYVLAVRSREKEGRYGDFFNSLTFLPAIYPEAVAIKDTFLRLQVTSPVAPAIDTDISSLMAYTRNSAQKLKEAGSDYSGIPTHRHANFQSEATGELITVDVTTYPEYHFSKSADRFWNNELSRATNDSDLVIRTKDAVSLDDGTTGYRLSLTDTGSSRAIKKLLLLQGNALYVITAMTDSRMPESDFIRTFFATARPYKQPAQPSVFQPKLEHFFADYYSADSLTRKRAREAIPSVYFGKEGFERIADALDRLSIREPGYFDLKTAWINELGYLDDSTVSDNVAATLERLYSRAGDTSIIQKAVLTALIRLKTEKATVLFRRLLLQDPPVYDDADDYDGLFAPYHDTLKLAAQLFPDLMQLAPIADFKPGVIGLLARLVDSGYIRPTQYESGLSNLFFDAKIALKKQRSEDEQSLRSALKQAGEDDDYRSFRFTGGADTSLGILYDYAVLLAPFYDNNPNIRRYFDQLLQSRKKELQLHTALLLMRTGKQVPDSLWQGLAAEETYRHRLFVVLNRTGHAARFPKAYAGQEALVRSALLEQLGDPDSIRLLSRQLVTYKGMRGYVYSYRYKPKNGADWKLAFTGPQPANGRDYLPGPLLVRTDIDLSAVRPVGDQQAAQLKRTLISSRNGGREFYESEGVSFSRLMSQFRASGRED